MKLDTAQLKQLSTALKRVGGHFKIISFVLAMGTLIYCVYSIQQVFNLPVDQGYYDQQQVKNTRSSFDKTTIDKVRQLHTIDDSTVTLPVGRINPFTQTRNTTP
jgi:spermidine/putrescine-binding protein